MNAVSSLLAMVSAVSLTLGVIHFRFWLLEKFRRDRLAFALLCCSAFLYSWLEIGLLHAATPEEYGSTLRLAQLPGFVALVSAAWFIYENLGTGREWLFWTFIGIRSLALIVSFAQPSNINFRQIVALGHVTVLGESLAYPVGVMNPLTLIPQASILVLLIFCLDALIAAWRRGDHSKAIVMGGGVTLFSMYVLILAILVPSGEFHLPWIISPAILFIAVAMGYELNRDIYRAGVLAKELAAQQHELTETVNQLNLSVGAANVGIWTRSIGDRVLHPSDKMREMFQFPRTGTVTFEDQLNRIHPADRGRFVRALESAESTGGEYSVQYKLLLDNREVRWIESRGTVEFEDGKPTILRGASVDVTQRKLAEESAHELGRKLMWAQEKERTRLARELHDDLSQRLALLSIQLAELKKHAVDARYLRKQVDHLTSEIQGITADVHRMSHELHPAKLDQLGLESALRGFCRELEAAHPISINLEVVNVPRSLSKDVSLCLYRVSQEAVQNAIKHSGASAVNLSVRRIDGEIQLDVSDNGSGFDPKTVRSKESLGLINIDERIRSVHGVVRIDSTVGAGTHIEAHVPIANDAGGRELSFVAST